MRFSQKILFILFILVPLNILLYLTGCYPDRVVTEPDYEVNEVRRPGISYIVPPDGATGIKRDTPIIIWFDELMDNNSVRDNFFVWPLTELDSIRTVIFDPENAEIIYAAKPRTGIFKSEDGGESWKWITKGTLRLNVTDLVISKQNSNVLYVASTDKGIYKSENGGVDWQEANEGLPEMNILSLSIDPIDDRILYACTNSNGLYKSVNGGITWVEYNNGLRASRPPQKIAINPLNTSVLYVATKGDFVFKSHDGGNSWIRLRNGFFTRNFKSLAIHPQDTSLVFAISMGSGIYRTKNGGNSWELIDEGLLSLDVSSIVVNPQDINQVWVSTTSEVYASNDMGNHWNPVGKLDPDAAIEKLALHSSQPERIFAATTAGVYESNDGGNTWLIKDNLPLEDLYIDGTFTFEKWQDSTIVIAQISESTYDTTVIFPYVNKRALAGWNGKGKPPVDPNPEATKMIFTPAEILLPEWTYQIRINGVFYNDKITIKRKEGAHDINGNSFETDRNFTFRTGQN